MIQVQTQLDVADNTGAKLAMCIKVLGASRRRYATLGDVVVLAVKQSEVSREGVAITVAVNPSGNNPDLLPERVELWVNDYRHRVWWIAGNGTPERKAREMSRPMASTSAINAPPALPSEMKTSNG